MRSFVRLLFFWIGFVFVTPALAADPQTIPILFLGDSLTEGYGVAKEKSYPTLVVAALNERLAAKKSERRVTALYGGVSGSTSASALSRFRWFLKARPGILFLALGANDGLRGLSVAEMEKNLEATLTLAREGKIPTIIAGMKLPPNYGVKNAKEFEAVFPRLAKKFRTPFVPFLLANVGGEKELNIEDGIHPNERGHEEIAKTILPILEASLPKDK